MPQLIECKKCDYITYNRKDFTRHESTRKHQLMTQKMTIGRGADFKRFVCEPCQFYSSDKYDFNRHLLTKKHCLKCDNVHPAYVPPSSVKEHVCELCSKPLASRQSLWRHRNACRLKMDEAAKNAQLDDQADLDMASGCTAICPVNQASPSMGMFMELLKQNQEFKELIMEQNNKIMELSQHNNTINNITNNTHNNQFNLNFFLNEKCKNALNLSDFVESIKLDFKSLENIGMSGYVEGVTRIFIDELKQLDIYKRPIHCTDIKRETMHIKEEDKWNKDTEENKHLKSMIRSVAHRNMSQIKKWQEEHKECEILDSDAYNLWMKIIEESLCSGDKTDSQIIRNLAKQVYIDRQNLLV